MKPIEVNWKIQLPRMPQINQMWKDLEFDIVDKEFEFIKLLKSNLGGDIYFKGFKVCENEIFDWFCSRGRLDEIDFNKEFLLSERVLKTFKRVEEDQIENRAYEINKKPKFNCKSEFVIDGELAALLYHGGAYGSKYKEEPKVIKEKARYFCNELFEEKYQHEYVRYYTSSTAWNSWFIDFIIDHTFLIICMKSRTIWVLAFTDTD